MFRSNIETVPAGPFGGKMVVSMRAIAAEKVALAADIFKVALVHLVTHMRERGMTLLDVQFMTNHLRRFGATEIPRSLYTARLNAAIRSGASFSDETPRIVLDDTGEAE